MCGACRAGHVHAGAAGGPVVPEGEEPRGAEPRRGLRRVRAEVHDEPLEESDRRAGGLQPVDAGQSASS